MNLKERITTSAKAWGWRIKSPKLKQLADFINKYLPLYKATIEKGFCNTDRKIGRLRHPGKGRYGNRIIVIKKSDGSVVIDHNSAETYRKNYEVCAKLVDLEGFFEAKEK